jgi:hypothetical protein
LWVRGHNSCLFHCFGVLKMNLSPPSTKHPLLEEDGRLNHTWQRWYSDVYDKIKELEAVSVSSPLGGNGTAGNPLTVDLSSKQAASSILSALAGLTWVSGSPLVRMTGAAAFSLDTATYLTSLAGAVLTDQTVGQTIGATGARLTKLWATDIICSNAIAGSVTGNAGTVTGLSFASGKTLTVNNILTLSGTDNSTLNIGAGGTLGSNAFNSTAFLSSVTCDSPLSGAGTAGSHLTVDLSSKQAASSILSALAGLSWVSGSPFVKMTGASSFALDTSTYLTSLSGAVLTDQTSGQTIGATGARLTKLWVTDITCTNTISGSVSGNAGTVTGLSVTAGKTLTVSDSTTLANASITLANTGSLTLPAAATTITGGGTLALATYTLTVPATGTCLIAGGVTGGQTWIGGTGVTDQAIIQGTSGNGTSTSAAITMKVGNNGALSVLTFLNNGNLGINNTSPTKVLDVLDSGYYDEVVTMTSDSAPSPYAATASTEVNTGNAAWLAFDHSTVSKWTASTNTGWLKYDFGVGSSKIIKEYTVIGCISGQETYAPKTWTFEASNDNFSTVTTLDTKTNVPAFSAGELRSYVITNTTGYRYYRINVSANQGGVLLAIVELGLLTINPRVVLFEPGKMTVGLQNYNQGNFQFITKNGIIDFYNATSTTLRNTGTALILEQTGDSYGTSRLTMESRSGLTGALFQTIGGAAIEVVDFGFQTNSGGQYNFRFERRTVSGLINAANVAGEFQFRPVTPSATAMFYVGMDNSLKCISGVRGKFGIGQTIYASPLSTLHLEAGSATANTAPLQFTSGAYETVARAGVMEFLTDNPTFVITTGAARKNIVLDDGTLFTSGQVPYATTNGRLKSGTIMTLDETYGLKAKQPYGSMSGDDVSIAVTVSVATTEYAVGAGLSAGALNGFTFANSVLTCAVAGKYIVTWSLTLQASNNNEVVEGGIMVNTTPQNNTAGSAEDVNAGKPVCVSGSGIITLAANDLVNFYVENDTAAHDITVTHATLTLNRVDN